MKYKKIDFRKIIIKKKLIIKCNFQKNNQKVNNKN